MKYNRTEIAENIGFSSVVDSKFKTNSLVIRFITELTSDISADNAMGIGVLSVSNSKYKTLSEMNEKLSSLYGASLGTSAKKRGDIQLLSLSASWINNRYAIDGENIDEEMLDIVCDCIFAPNANSNKFDADSFKITRKDLLDRIESEINNKRGYAISKASEIAFKGEPAEFSCYGTKESAEKSTAESSYAAYKNLLEKAQIEIFYVCSEENSTVQNRLKFEFSKMLRKSTAHNFISLSKAKTNIERMSDELDVNQSKMVMVFKSDSDDKYALKMFSTIYGETPVSKLFMNVREKLSLCYYCASRSVGSKGALFIDCGVEKSNIEKAENEIIHQLDELCNGNFTDEDCKSAIMSIDNTLTAVGDTPSSYLSWYFECFCENNIITPHQQLENYKAVTRERIINAAKSFKLDSVYVMLNKEATE